MWNEDETLKKLRTILEKMESAVKFNPSADTDEVMDFMGQNSQAFESFKELNSNKIVQARNEEQTFIVHRSTRTGINNWQITTFENNKPVGHETRETWEQAIDVIEDDIDWTDESNYKVGLHEDRWS